MQQLVTHEFEDVVSWKRGVDTDLFSPVQKPALDLLKPVGV